MAWHRGLNTFLVVVVAIGGFFVGRGSAMEFIQAGRVMGKIRAHDYHRMSSLKLASSEVVIVYIGSSTCPAANDPRLHRVVRGLIDRLSKELTVRGINYRTIGIAEDVLPYKGLQHLAEIGTFDELIAGGGSLNAGMQQFIWHGHPGLSATPQVVVLTRVRPDGMVSLRNVIEAVVLRKIGLEEIEQWLTAGVPLPDLPALSR